MGDALDITVRRERGVVIAAVAGDVDISTVARLRECLFELADSGRTLIVDLNRVTFTDSSGLGALIGAARRAAAHGGSLHAVCARPPTRRLLWLTGVDRRIPLAATVDGALMFLAVSPGRSRLVRRGGRAWAVCRAVRERPSAPVGYQSYVVASMVSRPSSMAVALIHAA